VELDKRRPNRLLRLGIITDVLIVESIGQRPATKTIFNYTAGSIWVETSAAAASRREGTIRPPLERLPDTVQTDHVDWGFRISGIYGEDNRYTTAYGVASYQLLGHNLTNIYDFPMIYGELLLASSIGPVPTLGPLICLTKKHFDIRRYRTHASPVLR
jgi:hypothetical protein